MIDVSRSPLTDAPVTVARLREIGLFGALGDDVLARLVASLGTRRAAPGETLFREGDVGRELYIVLDGEVEVAKRSRRGREMRVALLGPSDVFGDMSILDLQPRSASVRAVAPTRLLRVSSEDLDGVYRYDVKSYAILMLNLARDISRRLRVADAILAELGATALEREAPRALAH